MKKIYIIPQTKAVVLRSIGAVLFGSNPDSFSLGFSTDTDEEGYAD